MIYVSMSTRINLGLFTIVNYGYWLQQQQQQQQQHSMFQIWKPVDRFFALTCYFLHFYADPNPKEPDPSGKM